MVATAQREPFGALIRKIGYSVGLEHTRERVCDLVRVYVRDRQVTTTAWNVELVRDGWNLKSGHIADVFSSLNLVEVRHGGVDVLFGLDALAILRLRLTSAEFDLALDALLCTLILIADADIFLNCLGVDFDPDRVRDALLRMVRSKRALAHEAIRLTGLREKVDRVINIDTQKTNRGSAGPGRGVGTLVRTQPLGQGLGPLVRAADLEPHVSDDYLRKVPPKRREWARSIGLFDRDAKSARGQRLLVELTKLGARAPDGAYALWPFVPELMALHLTIDSAPWPTIPFDELCEGVFRAYRSPVGEPSTLADDQAFELLADSFKAFRSLNLQKSALRNELPLRVALLFQLGWNVTQSSQLSIPAVLAAESGSRRRRLESRTSRNHEGALVFGRVQ